MRRARLPRLCVGDPVGPDCYRRSLQYLAPDDLGQRRFGLVGFNWIRTSDLSLVRHTPTVGNVAGLGCPPLPPIGRGRFRSGRVCGQTWWSAAPRVGRWCRVSGGEWIMEDTQPPVRPYGRQEGAGGNLRKCRCRRRARCGEGGSPHLAVLTSQRYAFGWHDTRKDGPLLRCSPPHCHGFNQGP